MNFVEVCIQIKYHFIYHYTTLQHQMLLTSEQRHEIIDLKNKDSNTALHIACAQGYEDIAVHLMAKGADVKSRNYNNETPLHLASFYGQNE